MFHSVYFFLFFSLVQMFQQPQYLPRISIPFPTHCVDSQWCLQFQEFSGLARESDIKPIVSALVSGLLAGTSAGSSSLFKGQKPTYGYKGTVYGQTGTSYGQQDTTYHPSEKDTYYAPSSYYGYGPVRGFSLFFYYAKLYFCFVSKITYFFHSRSLQLLLLAELLRRPYLYRCYKADFGCYVKIVGYVVQFRRKSIRCIVELQYSTVSQFLGRIKGAAAWIWTTTAYIRFASILRNTVCKTRLSSTQAYESSLYEFSLYKIRIRKINTTANGKVLTHIHSLQIISLIYIKEEI